MQLSDLSLDKRPIYYWVTHNQQRAQRGQSILKCWLACYE